jgi:hypothetical protein
MTSSHDTKLGVVHAGPTAIDDLPDLVRAAGQGRVLILADAGGQAAAHTFVEPALARAHMPVTAVELSAAKAGRRRDIERAADGLATLSGAALVTVGDSALIAAGKTVAALATNPRKGGQAALMLPPRVHLVVPTALGPAEEATHLVTIDEHAEPVVDQRVGALSVIDDRLFPSTDPDAGRYKLLAVALAACTITNEVAALRDSTLALSAVHRLVDPQLRPVDVRQALTLAAAGHPEWPLCRRCQGGTVLPTAILDDHTAHSPARMCLQEAVARGLTVTA